MLLLLQSEKKGAETAPLGVLFHPIHVTFNRFPDRRTFKRLGKTLGTITVEIISPTQYCFGTLFSVSVLLLDYLLVAIV